VSVAQFLAVTLLRGYRWVISPAKNFLLGQTATCRFTPTCSAYALEAVRRHGAMQGCQMMARRLCRCHPWGDSGFDPVPELIVTEPISPTWTEKA
jgi:putative membrane protein insertion efficiency factor